MRAHLAYIHACLHRFVDVPEVLKGIPTELPRRVGETPMSHWRNRRLPQTPQMSQPNDAMLCMKQLRMRQGLCKGLCMERCLLQGLEKPLQAEQIKVEKRLEVCKVGRRV